MKNIEARGNCADCRFFQPKSTDLANGDCILVRSAYFRLNPKTGEYEVQKDRLPDSSGILYGGLHVFFPTFLSILGGMFSSRKSYEMKAKAKCSISKVHFNPFQRRWGFQQRKAVSQSQENLLVGSND